MRNYHIYQDSIEWFAPFIDLAQKQVKMRFFRSDRQLIGKSEQLYRTHTVRTRAKMKR